MCGSSYSGPSTASPSPAHHRPSPPEPTTSAVQVWLRNSDGRPLDDNSERAAGLMHGDIIANPVITLLYLLVSVSGSVSALNGVRFAKFSPIRSLTVCYLTDPTAHWLHLHQSPVSSMITYRWSPTSLAGWLAGWLAGIAWGILPPPTIVDSSSPCLSSPTSKESQ